MSDLAFLSSGFSIQNVHLLGRVLLAPMDGFTDSPFRRICKAQGSALSTSEFINGIDLAFGHPYMKFKTFFEKSERPFCFQIFDDDPKRLLIGAQKLAVYQPDLIDINMGCSARNVSNRGAGAGLLRSPEKIRQIACSMVSNLSIPVTAKIRLGWDESSRNYREIAPLLEDCGIAAITVHARTRRQEFTGMADWDAIAEVKSLVSIPVIGNGDVHSLEDALKMVDHTGCDAVMIGRAAIGNPWIFAAKNRTSVTNEDLLMVMTDHLNMMTCMYSDRIGTILFRKHLAHYLAGRLPTAEVRSRIFSVEDPHELLSEIEKILF